MTKKAQNSKVATPTFEIVANESDKQSLINNLDNFDIIKINKSTKKDEKFEIFSDSVVRISSELIKDGLILNTATQLFKCDTPITQLMRLGDGYGSAIMSNGKITGQAPFVQAGGDMAKILSPFLALQVASIVLGQHFMFEINEKLGQLLDMVKEISMKFEYEKIAKLKTIQSEIGEILEVNSSKIIDKSTTTKLEQLKEKAKDIFHYYETKIENTKIEKIDFGDNKRFQSRIERLLHNINDFDLNFAMYRHSKEILIYLYRLLYAAYMQNADFSKAEMVFNTLKHHDKVFDDKMSNKLMGITNKILEQLKYIQKHKDWIPNAVLKPFDTAVDKQEWIPEKAKSFVKFATDILWFNFNPIKEKIHEVATNDKDDNTAKPHIASYSKLQEEIKENNSKVIQDNVKFIQRIEQKHSIYCTEIDGDSYVLIEKYH